MRKEKLGFTLVEVMVTCAIIAILTSILYPVVGQAIQSAKETHSKNNLRQIYLGLMVYREQNDPKVEFGTQIDMGLPFNMELKETALSIVPDVATWRSRCCCHPLAPSGYPDYRKYFTDYANYFDGDDYRWALYVRRFEYNSVLVFDWHCNPVNVDIYRPRSLNVKGLGVYLNGKVETRVRSSIPASNLDDFWNY